MHSAQLTEGSITKAFKSYAKKDESLQQSDEPKVELKSDLQPAPEVKAD